MRLKTYIFTLLAATLLLVQPALAGNWEADKAHSNVYFGIQHIFSEIHGKFDDFDATVDIDPAAVEKGSIKLVIKTGSVNTGIDQRDEHLSTKDFFEVATYPEMVFESTSIKKTGKDQYDVTGKLTVKKTTREVTIPMTFSGPKDDPMNKGKKVIGLDSRFTIDRLDYGVGDGKFFDMGIVDRKVNVTVSMELHQ